MRPGSIGSWCSARPAGSGPARSRMVASALGASGGMCSTTNTAAGKSAGRRPTTRVSASTPPAEAPITTISWPLARFLIESLSQRQPDHEAGALRLRGLHLDRAVVCRHDGLHQVQPDAEAATCPLVGVVEALEHLLPILGGDTTAVVDHLHDGNVALAPRADVDTAWAGPVLHRVGDQVQQHLLQAARVAAHGQRLSRRGDADLLAIAHRPRQLDDILDQLSEVDPLARDRQLAR